MHWRCIFWRNEFRAIFQKLCYFELHRVPAIWFQCIQSGTASYVCSVIVQQHQVFSLCVWVYSDVYILYKNCSFNCVFMWIPLFLSHKDFAGTLIAFGGLRCTNTVCTINVEHKKSKATMDTYYVIHTTTQIDKFYRSTHRCGLCKQSRKTRSVNFVRTVQIQYIMFTRVCVFVFEIKCSVSVRWEQKIQIIE